MSSSEAATHTEFANKICRLTKSKVYLDLCEEICGYREYMFNMIDGEQLDYLLNNIPFKKTDTVLDLGCGNGGILRLIADKYGCRGIGVDTVSTEETEHDRIEYICADINEISSLKIKPTFALSIDGLYFGCDIDKLIRSLCDMNVKKFCFFWSQYMYDMSGNKVALDSDKTNLGTALKKAGIHFEAVDFGENEYNLYKRKKSILTKHKDTFITDNNLDLYEQILFETNLGMELYKKGAASRYLYIGKL